MLRRLTWGLLVLALGAVVVGAALASRTAAPPNPTFVLVQFPAKECPKPRVIVGKACVDKSEQILSADWTYSDGSGTLHPTGWTTSYTWSVPAVVPPAGAAIKMEISGEAKDVSSICPGMGAGGGFPLKPAGQEVQFSTCAQHGQTAKATHTITVTAPSGGPVYVLIGLGDGPRFTYKYEAQAAKPGCGKLKRSARPTGAADTTVVHWKLNHHGIPDQGESPTLRRSSTIGAGKLSLCLDPEAKSALATTASGLVLHVDVHRLFTSDAEREESLTLVVKRGAYGEIGQNAEKVSLDVEVSKSNDRDCPVGTRGLLSLVESGYGRDSLNLRLCGTSHKHYFVNYGGEANVAVTISRS